MKTNTAGYSATPLAKKLGIVEGVRVVTKNAPDGYAEWLAPVPASACFEKKISLKSDIVHLFARRKSDLKRELVLLRSVVRSDCAVWVSWPKKASKVPTDITENSIRELALPLGFVDIKVCAVSDVWSGLKLVIRRELR
jgi:hypothetical protein